jgi:hypothetical protein
MGEQVVFTILSSIFILNCLHKDQIGHSFPGMEASESLLYDLDNHSRLWMRIFVALNWEGNSMKAWYFGQLSSVRLKTLVHFGYELSQMEFPFIPGELL